MAPESTSETPLAADGKEQLELTLARQTSAESSATIELPESAPHPESNEEIAATYRLDNPDSPPSAAAPIVSAVEKPADPLLAAPVADEPCAADEPFLAGEPFASDRPADVEQLLATEGVLATVRTAAADELPAADKQWRQEDSLPSQSGSVQHMTEEVPAADASPTEEVEQTTTAGELLAPSSDADAVKTEEVSAPEVSETPTPEVPLTEEGAAGDVPEPISTPEDASATKEVMTSTGESTTQHAETYTDLQTTEEAATSTVAPTTEPMVTSVTIPAATIAEATPVPVSEAGTAPGSGLEGEGSPVNTAPTSGIEGESSPVDTAPASGLEAEGSPVGAEEVLITIVKSSKGQDDEEKEKEKKKKKHHRKHKHKKPAQTIFESTPKAPTADATARAPVTDKVQTKTIFEAEPRAMPVVSASAVRVLSEGPTVEAKILFESSASPSNTDAGYRAPALATGTSKAVYQSEGASSRADARANDPVVTKTTKSVYESQAKVSCADMSARAPAVSSPTRTIFERPATASMADVRAADPVPVSPRAQGIFESQASPSKATARAVDPAEMVSPLSSRTLYANQPSPSFADARVTDAPPEVKSRGVYMKEAASGKADAKWNDTTAGPKTEHSVYEAKPAEVEVSAKWNAPSTTQSSALIFQNVPQKSKADAAAGRSASEDSWSDSDTSSSSYDSSSGSSSSSSSGGGSGHF